MPRRQHTSLILITAVAAFIVISLVISFRSRGPSSLHPTYNGVDRPLDLLDDSILRGTATAQKLENATLKAELGNAAWKLMHTTMAKFPDEPSADDSTALKSFVYLFARLYPCGECARHFQEILERFPPQVATRSTAAAWACHVHNEVNKSLKKDLFDCSKIGDFYDCGCAGDDDTSGVNKSGKADEGREEGKRRQALEKFTPLELEKEG